MQAFRNFSIDINKALRLCAALALLVGLFAMSLPSASAVAGQVDANNVGAPPTIDGLLSEAGWNLVTSAGKSVLGSPNNTTTFGAMWDANYLYVGVKVLDANLFNDSANVWDDDAVEVMIDANHNHGTTYDSFDRQYLKGYNDTSLFAVGSATGVVHGVAAISGGYSIELAIPWSNLGVTPTTGLTMGLDVGYDDDDNGGVRDGQAVWWGTANDWGDTSAFGDVMLMGGGPTATFTPTATRTNTPVGPTATPTHTPTRTNTPTGPTATRTNTPVPPTATHTNTPTATPSSGTVSANNITTPPTIDGLLNEAGWNLVTSAGKSVLGSPNNTVTFGTMWDGSYLYVGVKVLDANLFNDSANVWDDDAVEVFIDANHNHGTTYDSFDRQYVKGYNDTSLLAVGSATGVVHGVAAISGGYSIELAIPWSNLGVTPTTGLTMGLDVGYDDDDNGGVRDGQAVWWGTANDWGDTSAFGDMVLTGGSGPTATNTTAAPTATRTNTPVGPTATPTHTPTRTNTPSGPTATSPGTTIFNESATNDSTNVYYSYSYLGTYSWYRVYIDTDENSATGYATTGIGADYLLEGANLFSSCGTGWCWTLMKTVAFNNPSGSVNWAVARSDIGETAVTNSARILFQVEAPLTTSVPFTHYYSINGTIVPTITLTPTTTRTPTITPTPMPPTPTNPPGGSQTVTYTASTAIITNPERGFDHTNTDCQSNLYSAAQLQGYRENENMSIVLCNFYLEGYQTTTTLPQSVLNALQTQLNTIRTAGFKVVLRFSYSKTSGNDADVPTVQAHINQFAPIIQANSDVIALWQGSFIGQWGEGYYTTHYGNAGVISPQQWADRKAVYDAQLAALPTTRMISLRTPLMMTTMYGSTTVNSSTAFNGSAVSRIGQHNDAFLASADDWGTYSNVSIQYPWLEAQSTYTIMGGESEYGDTVRVQCPTALQEMGMFHWSYANIDYNPSSIAAWTSGGCLPTIKQKLGYRFVLTQGTYPNHASAGGPLNVQLSIRNDGFAAPYNPRNREIILRNNSTGALYRFPLTSDPRFWLAGTTTNINQTFTLPSNIPNGNYALLLNLSDPASALSARPEYSIQTANVSTWESNTGFNNLLKTVTIP